MKFIACPFLSLPPSTRLQDFNHHRVDQNLLLELKWSDVNPNRPKLSYAQNHSLPLVTQPRCLVAWDLALLGILAYMWKYGLFVSSYIIGTHLSKPILYDSISFSNNQNWVSSCFNFIGIGISWPEHCQGLCKTSSVILFGS